MGRFVYLPFFIVTLIQMLGNIFFSFTFIDETSQSFQDWISMMGGLFENMGVDRTDLNTHKTILSFLTGGLLPIISLTFAHMLVKFSENETKLEPQTMIVDLPTMIAKKEEEDLKSKFNPTQEQLDLLEKLLTEKYKGPEQVTPTDEPYNPSEEELFKLQEILGLDNNENQSKVKFNLQEVDNSNSIENEELINEEPIIVPESEEIIQTEPETSPHNLIVEHSSTYDDKKKIDELFEKNEDYKILNYTKRYG
jgi:hypothetical protein